MTSQYNIEAEEVSRYRLTALVSFSISPRRVREGARREAGGKYLLLFVFNCKVIAKATRSWSPPRPPPLRLSAQCYSSRVFLITNSLARKMSVYRLYDFLLILCLGFHLLFNYKGSNNLINHQLWTNNWLKILFVDLNVSMVGSINNFTRR